MIENIERLGIFPPFSNKIRFNAVRLLDVEGKVEIESPIYITYELVLEFYKVSAEADVLF